MFNEKEQLVEGMGIWLGEKAVTNNEAEVSALQAVVKFLIHNKQVVTAPLTIIWDSKLILDFMRGSTQPSKPFLFTKIQECKKLVWTAWAKSVHFIQVPREQNAIADWLAN